MRVGVISDTHGRLPAEVFELFAGVDLIVHAGDIGSIGILDDLAVLAPVVAVYGNTDGMEVRRRVRAVATHDVAGRRLVVTHGDPYGVPTAAALRADHPDADIIVFGHTHRPLVDPANDRLVLNPGSAGAPRYGLEASVALLAVGAEGVTAEVLVF
jgi:uncharacterized protein